MDFLDAILIVLIIGSLAHGLRVGAAVQLLTLIGVLAGVILGAYLTVEADPHVTGTLAKALIALGFLVIPAVLFGGFGRHLGIRAWRAIRRVRFGLVDAFIGALLAAAGTLVVLWLFASILVNSPSPLVAGEISNSAVLRGIDRVMPPVPDAFARLEEYLAQRGFPQVLFGVAPGPIGPVPVATGVQTDRVGSNSQESTVKVVSVACGEDVEGSGFDVAGGFVVTNAHVVAGATTINVTANNGSSAIAVPVYFNPRYDLAILDVASGGAHPLGIRPLTLDPDTVGRGTRAVFLGYPEDGSYTASPAGVVTSFTAEGRDIYDEATTLRDVYEVKGVVEPGNSGGPLLSTSGQVIGVIFSRSASNHDVGFALTSPGVVARLDQVIRQTRAGGGRHAVSTGACVG